MVSIKCHIFATKEEADAAMETINNHRDLPKDENALTIFDERSYEAYQGGYFIHYSKKWTSILGNPVIIELEEE